MITGSGGGSRWPGMGSLRTGSNRETWNTGCTFIVGGVCFCFITLDLAAETVDFNCGMMQLVYEGVPPFGN
jgi:hypothetical protein